MTDTNEQQRGVRLYVFGNATGPRLPRLKDLGVTSEDDVVQPEQPGPDMKGASSFADTEKARELGLTGPYHALASEVELPEGLGVFEDDPSTTHHTIYAVRPMTYREFCEKFASIAWERKVGRL